MKLEEMNSKIKGKYILEIEGLEKQSEKVVVKLQSREIVFEHDQDCCETVYLADFESSLNLSLSGSPRILEVKVSTKEATESEVYQSGLWTFIEIKTTQGDIWMRWMGESNGYYSEAVDITFREALWVEYD